MKTKSFWVSLTMMTLAGCLINAQSFEREIRIEHQHDIYAQQKAIKLQAGRIWIYSTSSLTLDCFDPSGNLLLEVELGKATRIPSSDFRHLDYAVDNQGSIHLLGNALDSHSKKPFTYLLNFDATGRQTGEYRLEHTVAVGRVAMTPEGNLAVLGLDEDGMSLERKRGMPAKESSKIKLLHLFSPTGNWLRSLGETDGPSDSKGWTKLRSTLDHFLVVDPAGTMHFQTDQSRLCSVTPDGQLSEFEIPTAERQVRLVVTLVPCRSGLLVVLAEGLNTHEPEITQATGLWAMENPKQAAYLLGPDGLRLVQADFGDQRTRIIGQTDDGRWVKAKLTDGRAAFSIGGL